MKPPSKGCNRKWLIFARKPKRRIGKSHVLTGWLIHSVTVSSGAELTHIHVPNYLHPSLHIWTKVGNELFDDVKYGISYETAQRHLRGELTDEEFVNAVFEPQEQVSVAQAQLLGAAFMLASGGPAQAHVGTGGGGSQSDLPWREKRRNGYGVKKRR
ncbi:hypothetical protein LGV59_14965 [Bacteroides fragilis]|nr:hypothetical protein [Bacteroides fragilis]